MCIRDRLTHDKGRTYATITNIFEQAGYTIQKKVLNAWDFGVPQKRERLILSLIHIWLQSVCLYRSYRQEARQAAAAACSSLAAFPKETGLRIYCSATAKEIAEVETEGR